MSVITETSNGKQPRTPVNPKVKLCIQSEDGNRLYFRVRSDKKIQMLFLAYCKEIDMDYNDVSFLYDGQRIKATKTPNELGMKDKDEIDAIIHQTGGVYNP